MTKKKTSHYTKLSKLLSFQGHSLQSYRRQIDSVHIAYKQISIWFVWNFENKVLPTEVLRQNILFGEE